MTKVAPFNAKAFTLRAEPPPLMGGISVGDETNPAWLFSKRYGERWKRVLGISGVYVLPDSLGLVHFSIRVSNNDRPDDIAAYFGDTAKEFLTKFKDGDTELFTNCIYFDRDPVYKHTYLQLNKFLQERDNGVF